MLAKRVILHVALLLLLRLVNFLLLLLDAVPSVRSAALLEQRKVAEYVVPARGPETFQTWARNRRTSPPRMPQSACVGAARSARRSASSIMMGWLGVCGCGVDGRVRWSHVLWVMKVWELRPSTTSCNQRSRPEARRRSRECRAGSAADPPPPTPNLQKPPFPMPYPYHERQEAALCGSTASTIWCRAHT